MSNSDRILMLEPIELLSMLPTLVLDKYVLDVITDPAILVKLLLAKLGNCSISRAIKCLRNMRNKMFHNVNIDQCDIVGWRKALIEIKDWILTIEVTNTQIKCIILCDEIMRKIDDLYIQKVPEKISVIQDTLLNFKLHHREYIKGKRIQILDGLYKDKVVIFRGWNGNRAKLNLDGHDIYFRLDRTVKLIC